jgi:regulator of RNase E activity RraA
MIGAWWGECNATTHRALGCVGSICDGGIRDVDEMIDIGFKVLARGMCVGHAHSWPVEWDCEVEVFGRTVKPGQLIHADKHGFLVIPKEDEAKLLDAATFMDEAECTAFIPTVRDVTGKSTREILDGISDGLTAFRKMVGDKFGRKGEW